MFRLFVIFGIHSAHPINLEVNPSTTTVRAPTTATAAEPAMSLGQYYQSEVDEDLV